MNLIDTGELSEELDELINRKEELEGQFSNAVDLGDEVE